MAHIRSTPTTMPSIRTLLLGAAFAATASAQIPAGRTRPADADASTLVRRLRPAVRLENRADTAFTIEERMRYYHVPGVSIAVVEGVMGLFDGRIDGRMTGPATGSTAHVAGLLGAPVILVVDAKGQSHSIAALLHGFSTFDDATRIAGVILNRVGSPRHEDVLRQASTQLPWGRLARPEEIARGIVFLVDPDSDYITGSTLSINGGSLLPWWSKRGTGEF